MEIYFNPFPGAAKTEEEGIRSAVMAADSLLRLKKECSGVSLSAKTTNPEVELPPSKFILVRSKNGEFDIGSLMFKTGNAERDKLRLLLLSFSQGKIVVSDEILKAENWILSAPALGVPAPLLELAVKNKAIALTIPTEQDWCVDKIEFENQQEILHNLWGQSDLSIIKQHCIDSISNIPDRFCNQFNATFCTGALNSAPPPQLWENSGFFQKMERAKERNYAVDSKLVKSLVDADTKYGSLLELRMHSEGQRIFFVHRKDSSPEIIIGGFYGKSSGEQNAAIQQAKKRIDEYKGNGQA
ncbi:MAG: hypothetical protein FWG66_15740 [Spirochaetes bacterium]|nr:hypothetical protein [Spirochaetota bacterium]